MSQIFHPSTNTISRVSIYGAVFLVAGLGWLFSAIDRSSYATGKDVVVEQPVPFSHDHHVGEIGIDCRYCHTSVETSSSAGMPSTAVCMNCHSVLFADAPLLEPVRASFRDEVPIAWTRVYDLPDFVYFDHSIHVAKGVGCVSCHGRIDKMPLTWRVNTLQMEWCLSCHRDPASQIRPRDKVFDVAWQPEDGFAEEQAKLAEEYGVKSKMSCSVCHR
jgi:hypothetical protein